MASNKELTKTAQELAAELKISIEDMPTKNDDLRKLVSDLKAKKRDADNETVADGTDEGLTAGTDDDTGEGEPEVTIEPNCHVIAEGKAVTSKRGILGPGDVVTGSDFTDKFSFVNFQKTGHIIAAVR